MKVKFVVNVPLAQADVVREAIGNVGAGVIGNYEHCSFSSRGQGRCLPTADANPFIGEPGIFDTIEEERIEVTCPAEHVHELLVAVRKVHPYEEIAYDIYPLLELDDLK